MTYVSLGLKVLSRYCINAHKNAIWEVHNMWRMTAGHIIYLIKII